MEFQPYDIIVAIALLWAAFAVYRDGLIKQVFSWVGFLFGLYLGFHYGTSLAERAGIPTAAAFIILCIGMPLVFSFLASLLTRFLDWTIGIGVMNRLAGVALSVFKYAFLISFVTYFGSQLINIPPSITQGSHFYVFFHDLGIRFWNMI